MSEHKLSRRGFIRGAAAMGAVTLAGLGTGSAAGLRLPGSGTSRPMLS